MKFFSCLALASLAIAAPARTKQAPSPLDVQIQMQGNSKVKAIITNHGKNNLKVLRPGTILDAAAVEKAQVFSGEKHVAFDGVRLRLDTSRLDEDAFEHIPAGQSVEVLFDVAELHDLSAGGDFDIMTAGALSFAEEASTELVGSVPFKSNRLKAHVDGVQASATRVNFLRKRTRVQNDCTGNKLAVTQRALNNCANMASAAQQAAASGPDDKMVEFFKSADRSTRKTVSDVFSKVAAECGSTNAGSSRYHCSDVYGACSSGVLAYTVPGQSYLAFCDQYFSELPTVATMCHAQDQATTNIHEMTHLTEVKGTLDYGGYGYQFLTGLSAEENLNHADSYAVFANAIHLQC